MKMDNKTLLIIALAAVAGYFLFFRKDEEKDKKTNEQAGPMPMPAGGTPASLEPKGLPKGVATVLSANSNEYLGLPADQIDVQRAKEAYSIILNDPVWLQAVKDDQKGMSQGEKDANWAGHIAWAYMNQF